jgi:uncharacterized protein (DUF2141 family)
MKILLMAASLLLGVSAQATELKLEFHGKGLRGNPVRVAIYSANAPEQFPSDEKYYRNAVGEATGERVTVTFSDLPPGKYAVAAYVDSNNNGKQDKNGLGMPTEIFGFSNNARGTFGPPDFAKAAFDLGEAPLALSIHLH